MDTRVIKTCHEFEDALMRYEWMASHHFGFSNPKPYTQID
jgi:hypothetical protein